jgi:response regulator NasT
LPREKLRAVVVDDEPIIRMDMVSMLENAGHEVVGQGVDGFEAIDICQRKKPDVIILDINMDILDGLSAAKIISEECKETAIILLTAYNKGEYGDKTRDCRISSYLVKPVEENQLKLNMELAVARNKELLCAKQGESKAIEKLESRKLLDRAKGMIMYSKGVSEENAYSYIREISKKRNISMAKVADIIIRQHEG